MIPDFVQSERVGVKICGLTTAADAEATIEAGADALGFNFWPRSKRYLDPAQGQWLREFAGKTERVGVFVNATDDEVQQLLDDGLIDTVQFHGDEPAERCAEWSAKVPFLRAFGIKDRQSIAVVEAFELPAVLLDAYCPGEYGGSGEGFDWQLGAEFIEANPENRVVLAGGLVSENVADAVAGVRPAAVDVASGVESAPGIKDLAKVRAFIEAARA